MGTVFELRASGDYRVLHRFTGGADGLEPYAGVTLYQGSVYGVTTAGGDPYCYCGVVFSIKP
ncbi:MAG: hypothetical protein H0X25_16870 [Acidobacteriales bacterium]|nr:hypothetical protein [Terriglobales bacterium]